MGKRRRKLLWIAGLTLGGFFLLLFSMPLWLPWVLRPVAPRLGAQYQSYERLGYSRFALKTFVFTNEDANVKARRIEAFVPTMWLWRKLQGRIATPFLQVRDWDFQSIPTDTPAKSTYTNAQQVAVVLEALKRWVPMAELSRGTVHVEKVVLEFPVASWRRGTLNAEVRSPQTAHYGTMTARLYGKQPYDLSLSSDSLGLQSRVEIFTDAKAITVQSTNLWWSNRVVVNARFEPGSMLPDHASLQATQLHIPAQSLRLTNYESLDGSVTARWEQRKFAIDAEAAAHPVAGKTNLPPLQVSLHAKGDTNAATIESALVSSPWLRVELSRNIQLHFSGALLREPALLNISADLAEQPWAPLEGVLRGRAELTPAGGKYPSVKAVLSGAQIGNTNVRAAALQLEGDLRWPKLAVAQVKATFDDGSLLAATGGFDFESKVLAETKVQFEGPLLRRWMPHGYGYDNLSFSATADGSLDRLNHYGRLDITKVTSPVLQPLQTTLSWRGMQTNIQRAELVAATTNSSLSTQFALEIAPTGTNLLVEHLQVDRGGTNLLALKQPCRMALNLADQRQWQIDLEPFQWAGPAGEVQAQGSVQWPRQGHLRVRVRNLHPELIQDFIKTRIEPLQIGRLDCNAGWTNGPLYFGLQFFVAGAPRNVPLSAEADMHGDHNGIVISNCVVTSQTSSVAMARGTLPVTIHPYGRTNLLALDFQRPLQLVMSTTPKAMFWDQLADWTGVALSDPSLSVNLDGTWAAPRGAIKLQARKIEWRKAKQEMPSFEQLNVAVALDRESARLTEGGFLVQGQPVTFSGETPLGESFWHGLKEKQIPNWKQARGRLRIDDAQLAAFSLLLPTVLSPQGRVALEVSLEPGGKLNGKMTLREGRTRSLPHVGPIRDIEARVRFAERTLVLERVRARIGGASVLVAGTADLSGSNWLKQVPPFQVTLRGTNVPLSRQPESVLRSDLDLAVTKTNGMPALISGTARLRDSFFLRDLQDLVPDTVTSPRRRPPYFSIEEPPLADWRLAAHVTGSRFLRVRSTLFSGEVSVNLRLEGTLREPIALGDVQIDSGLVRFPFGSLEVQQGFVSLSSEDPFRPRLLVTAASKKFGYDVKMEASGPADAPVLQFSSTPPLSSEQIVLLLTAGEVPSEEFTLTPEQKAQTVAVFLGRDLLTKLGVGDDNEERLTFQSGEHISEQGRPTYSVEYKLTDRWSLTGEYDRFNAFNAGVKWRVFSR